MLGLIIRKEILSNILSLRFGVTFLLFIVLIFTSIYVTANEHEVEISRYGSRVRGFNERLADILEEKDGERLHDRLFHDEGKSDAVPVAKLAWLGQGLQSDLPVGIVATRGSSQNIDRGLTRNPLMGMLPAPDFVYMVNVVLSLLAILFMFDSVCGEKEMGTLRLILSNSVPRYELLLGKWIGGFLVLMAPFLIATAGGIVYAWATGVLQGEPENLLRIGVIVLLAACYIGVFFNLSMFVSATTHNSATALLICLLLWVVFILAVPNMAPVTAKIMSPTPSPKKIEAEKRAVREETNLKKQRLNVTSGELRYGDAMKRKQEALDAQRDRELARWDRYYDNARKNQFDLAQALGRISPSASWIFASTALTDTGPAFYQRLEEAVTRWSQAFSDLHRAVRRERGSSLPPATGDELRDIIPSLSIEPTRMTESVTDSLLDILLLMVLNVVFFMLAFMFFLRYDVR